MTLFVLEMLVKFTVSVSWLGSLIFCIDLFVKQNCSYANQFRGDSSNETRLLMGAVVKLLLAVPISLAGVLTFTEMLSSMFYSNMLLPSRHAIFQEYSLSVPSALQCSGHPGNI